MTTRLLDKRNKKAFDIKTNLGSKDLTNIFGLTKVVEDGKKNKDKFQF